MIRKILVVTVLTLLLFVLVKPPVEAGYTPYPSSYVVSVNTSDDGVPGDTGYWVKDCKTSETILATYDANAVDDIQYAMDLLIEGGDVFIASGWYNLSAGLPLQFRYNNVAVSGNEWSTILDATELQTGDGYIFKVGRYFPVIEVENCFIRNLQMQVYRPNQHLVRFSRTTSSGITGCYGHSASITELSEEGIVVDTSYGIRVTGNKLQWIGEAAIDMFETSSGWITDNHIIDCGPTNLAGGISVGYHVGEVPNENIEISGNKIEYTGLLTRSHGMCGYGTNINFHDNTIIGADASSHNYDAITPVGGVGNHRGVNLNFPARGIFMRNNVFYECTGRAVISVWGEDIIVDGNVFIGCTTSEYITNYSNAEVGNNKVID